MVKIQQATARAGRSASSGLSVAAHDPLDAPPNAGHAAMRRRR